MSIHAGERSPRPLIVFFALAFGFTWAPQLVALAAMRGAFPQGLVALAGLGIFGPLIAALITASTRDGGGRASIVHPFFARHSGSWVYPVALLLPGAILATAMAMVGLVGDREVTLVYPPADAARVFALFVVPVVEEIGWRGFALPRLERRFGVLPASLLLGAFWALWHVPMFALAEVPLAAYPLGLVFFVAGSVVFSWIYHRAGGSLLAVIVAHVGAHLSNSHLALPDLTPFAAHTAGFVVVALALALLDRRSLPWARVDR